MYCAFQLDRVKFSDAHITLGEDILSMHRKVIEPALAKFITEEDELDASKMMDEWFPEVDAHVFISHSHADEHIAKGLAGFLYSHFKIFSFVDSLVWGYGDNLINIIDKKYCYNRGRETFNYTLRNRSTAHVHMMVSVALSKMLARSECVFFLKTPNSMRLDNVVTRNPNAITISPWIFAEIAIIGLLPKQKPTRLKKVIAKSFLTEDALPDVLYPIDLTDFKVIDFSDLNKWIKGAKGTPEECLDHFYNQVNV